MTTVKERSPLDKVMLCLDSQLLIRVMVWRGEFRSHYEHCRIEIMNFSPGLECSSCWKGWGFAHLLWFCGYEEKKRQSEMQPSPFYLRSLMLEPASTKADAHKRVKGVVAKVFDGWRESSGASGPQPPREWAEPKPFVGVTEVGMGHPRVPSTRVLDEDARPLLIYYGCLLSRLDAYLLQLKLLCKEYDQELEARYELFNHLTYRLRSFVWQRQDRLTEALYF